MTESHPSNNSLQPQIWSSVLQQLQLPLSEYKIDMLQLCKDCGIDIAALEHPHSQLPLNRYLAVLNQAVSSSDEPLLSIKLAKAVGVELLGALGFLCLNSRTLSEALRSLCHYQNLLQGATQMTLVPDGDYYVFGYELFGLGNIDIRQDVEFSIGFTSQFIRTYSNNRVKPRLIEFRHSPQAPISQYERQLAVPCSFGHINNQIYISAEDIHFRGSRYEQNLLQILTDYLDEDLQTKLSVTSFSEQIRRLLVSNTKGQLLTAQTAADKIGVSKPTLNRRLPAEGTSFKQLQTEIQYELAVTYLNNSRFTISQISQMLGFASPAGFSRAFAKWSGNVSPKNYRNRLA